MPTRKRIKHGVTPFPDHAAPSPDECQRVWGLLTAFHGPGGSVIAKPSTTVAGCGEVDDVLDALCRTIISGATQMARADAAVQNLVAEFGGGGTVDWLAVADAPSDRVHAAIKGCGLGNKKTEFVKALCARVRADNTARLAALLGDKRAGIPSPPPSPLESGGSPAASPWTSASPASSPGVTAVSLTPATATADAAGAAAAAATRRRTITTTTTKESQPSLPYSEEDRDAEIAELSSNILSLQRLRRPDVTVADALRQLSAFQGVSVKTAACVVLFCLRKPCLAVDTHVWRLARWLGWVPDRAGDQQTFYHLEVRVPDHLKYDLHQLLVFHGQSCYRCSAGSKDRGDGKGGAKWEACVCPLEDLLDRRKGDAAAAKGKADAAAASPVTSASPAASTPPVLPTSPAATGPSGVTGPPTVNVAVPPSITHRLSVRAHELPPVFMGLSQISRNIISKMNKPMSEPTFNVLSPPTPSIPIPTDLTNKQEVKEEENEDAEMSTEDVTMTDACRYSDPIFEKPFVNHETVATAHHFVDPRTEESGAEWRYIVDKAMAPYRRADLEASVQLLPVFRQLDEMMVEDRKADLEAIDDFYDEGGRQ